MHIATAMLGYLSVSVALASGLAGGALWLARPDASQRATSPARAAPIPPRIAESIERRRPLPAPPAEPLAVATPAAVRPTMQESNVALNPKPPIKFVIRELSSPTQEAEKRIHAAGCNNCI